MKMMTEREQMVLAMKVFQIGKYDKAEAANLVDSLIESFDSSAAIGLLVSSF